MRPRAVKPHQSERQFQAAVIDLAQHLGWSAGHFHDSRRQVTRRTGERLWIGDRQAQGFPDLVLVRERVIFAELKTDIGRLTTEQKRWLQTLGRAGAEVYVWRPECWLAIERTLSIHKEGA